MPRYIDLDAEIAIMKNAVLERKRNGTDDEFVSNIFDIFINVLNKAPSANVQEVVRCKNCKFFDPYDKVEDFDGQCVVRDCETDKEEFCSYGRKRLKSEVEEDG